MKPITIPQTDPLAGYRESKAAIDAAIARVLDGGRYILGPEVSAIETEFAGYLGSRHAIGVANGTDAIELALRACGVGHGDVVLTVSHTAVATVSAIERAGAHPCFVDIDPETYTMCPASLERTLRSPLCGRPSAIVAVHLYGHPAPLGEIGDVAAKYGLAVIEDCAQAHGARLGEQMIGSIGSVAAFSFYPTKNMAAIGDGGMIVTGDDSLDARAREIRQYGWRERYVSAVAGVNSRLDEIQAAILRVRLRQLDNDNGRRQQIAAIYSDRLTGAGLKLPSVRPGATHVFHQYVVRTPNRDGLQSHLLERGIHTAIHYPVPVHLQPAYEGRVQLDPSGLEVTETVAGEILSLPMFPQLAGDDALRVAGTVAEWALQ